MDPAIDQIHAALDRLELTRAPGAHPTAVSLVGNKPNKLFLCTWKVLDTARVDTLTMFGSMDEEADAQDMGQNVKLHGRFHRLGMASGYVVTEAATVSDVYNWIYNWSEGACDCEITPVCDDDTAREVILKKEPEWKADYYRTMPEPLDGESMWAAEYSCYPGCKVELHQTLASLTKEADTGDSGACTPLGRWHDLGRGTGLVIASAKSEKDLYAWANNWAALCEVRFYAVLTDRQCRAIISGKPQFAAKLQAVQEKLGIANQ
jgi:hypothetical protein